jgi:hypothetical protein
MKDIIDSIVFVYKHKKTGEIFARGRNEALAFEDDENYEHIATLNAAAWIQRHYNRYDSAKEFGMAVANAVNQAFVESVSPNAIEAIVDGVMKK